MWNSYRDDIDKHKAQNGKDVIKINDDLIYNYLFY